MPWPRSSKAWSPARPAPRAGPRPRTAAGRQPERGDRQVRRQRAVPLDFLTVQAFDTYEFERMTVSAHAEGDRPGAEDAAQRGRAAYQIGRRRRRADPGGRADRVLDQSGLVIERPGTGAAGLAGVGPVGTNRALGAGDRAGRPGPGRVHGRGVLLPGRHLVPGAEGRGRAAVNGPTAAGRVHPADLQRPAYSSSRTDRHTESVIPTISSTTGRSPLGTYSSSSVTTATPSYCSSRAFVATAFRAGFLAAADRSHFSAGVTTRGRSRPNRLK